MRVAAILANSKRFDLSDISTPLSHGQQSTHSTLIWDEIRIVMLRLLYTST